ncbi:molecular chaperone DjiA [Glacieibacterium frigidum]|uniref:Molecular chaperone DjiA n=1 Tax=Glacieibacterium frigidum TaxID=2593303 RepID=A0A552U8K2_9SPHN|nr:molecular chaperone DjiA [Glacieibacterium frigidum]
MGVWSSVIGTAAGLLLGAGSGASNAPASPRRAITTQRGQVSFTIAAIALAAKMARADGVASAKEFATFERLFEVPAHERANAARFYRLAQGSTAGFETYANQAAGLLGLGSPVLEDLLEALLLIARHDGFHVGEDDFLCEVARRFGFDAAAYARIRARHDASVPDDAWTVLGVPPGSDAATVRAAYRELVKTYHPDRHIAAGLPIEFVRVAETRMAAINGAYASLRDAAGRDAP